MGLEEHLIGMFRGDFEFHEDAAPSHLGGQAQQPAAEASSPPVASAQIVVAPWSPDAEKELRKIPFFVRGKAKRNTERYAQDKGVPLITIETLYDAKAHFSR
jgi:light-independent protochlorophyllide reductase subunit B